MAGSLALVRLHGTMRTLLFWLMLAATIPACSGSDRPAIARPDALLGACLFEYNTAFAEADAGGGCCYRLGGENECNLYHPCSESAGGQCCTVYSTDATTIRGTCCAYSTAGPNEVPTKVIRTDDCFGSSQLHR